MPTRFDELTETDLQKLQGRWIDLDTIRAAHLGRVDPVTGAGIVGRNGSGSYEGIVIPNFLPGEKDVREFRLRRDHPDLELQSDGTTKVKNKYLSPPGRGNLLYFPPNTQLAWLADTAWPIVFVEGEFKTLALWRLSWHGLGDCAERPRFLPVGLSGVWNWRGVVERKRGPDGELLHVKGPIPDLNRLALQGRETTILFDRNVEENESVRAARAEFTKELKHRLARVSWSRWPKDTPESVNGIDDYLAIRGPDAGLKLIEDAAEAYLETGLGKPFQPPAHWKWLDVAKVREWEVAPLVQIVPGIIAQGNFVFVAAQSQTGKTLLWLYIARTLVHGGTLFGKFQVAPTSKVLYVVLEDPDRRIKERLLDTDHEFSNPLEDGRFIVHVVPGFSLRDPAMLQYMEKLIKDHGFNVIVLDTYQRATPGISSFRDEEQSLILHCLANLTRVTGITLIALDHVRKDVQSKKRSTLTLDNVKGTGGKAQNADCIILMERTGKARNQIKFQSFSKDFDVSVGILLEVAPQGSLEPKFKYLGELSERAADSRRKGEQTKTKVLESVSPEGWISCGEVASTTEVSEATARRYLSELIEEGLVDHNSQSKKLKKYRRIAHEPK